MDVSYLTNWLFIVSSNKEGSAAFASGSFTSPLIKDTKNVHNLIKYAA